jgi:hypothetical protein
LEDASAAVDAVLRRLWHARAAVLDAWAARLYAPPVPDPVPTMAISSAIVRGEPVPESAVPVYDLSVMVSELQVVGRAGQSCTATAAAFKSECSAYLSVVCQAAENADEAGDAAAGEQVRRAANAAFEALRDGGAGE